MYVQKKERKRIGKRARQSRCAFGVIKEENKEKKRKKKREDKIK